MSLSPVHHCALTVSDLDRSVAFYTEILGFRMGLEFPLNPAHNRAFLHVPRGTSARCAMLQHGSSTVGQIELLEFDPPIPSGASPMRPGDVGLFLMSFEVHEETLQQIAAITNAKFYRATDSEGLRSIYAEINSLEKSDVEILNFTRYQELAPWLLVPALTLLVVELVLSQTVLRRLP